MFEKPPRNNNFKPPLPVQKLNHYNLDIELSYENQNQSFENPYSQPKLKRTSSANNSHIKQKLSNDNSQIPPSQIYKQKSGIQSRKSSQEKFQQQQEHIKRMYGTPKNRIQRKNSAGIGLKDPLKLDPYYQRKNQFSQQKNRQRNNSQQCTPREQKPSNNISMQQNTENIEKEEEVKISNEKPKLFRAMSNPPKQDIILENEPQIDRNMLSFKKNVPLPPQVSAKCWSLFDKENMSLIDGKNVYQERQIASLTKIMTLYTTLKLVNKYNIDSSQIYFQVSKQAVMTNGTSACLKEGQWVNLEDLYYGLMLPSGNDAAMVLAENMGGMIRILRLIPDLGDILYQREIYRKQVLKVRNPVAIFLVEMNNNANKLGLKQTNYANPHGLFHKNSRSTAYDQAKLCCKALKYEVFRKVVGTLTYKCNLLLDNGTQVDYKWDNTNKLLSKADWYGIKTGITPAAGPCLASAVKLQDYFLNSTRHFIVILLCSDTMDIRWEECEKLTQWALQYDSKI